MRFRKTHANIAPALIIIRSNVEFGKYQLINCAYGENFVRRRLTTEFALQTRRVYRGRAFGAGFRKTNARNGTQPEPRRKHNFIHSPNSTFIDT